MFSKFQWNWTTFIFCIIIITINCLIKIMINCLIIIMINCFIIIMINCCIIIVADNCDLLLMNQVYKFITWFLLSYSKLLIQRCLWFAVVACFGYNILFPVAFAIRNRGAQWTTSPCTIYFQFYGLFGETPRKWEFLVRDWFSNLRNFDSITVSSIGCALYHGN